MYSEHVIPTALKIGPLKTGNTWMGLQNMQLVSGGSPLSLTGAKVTLTVYAKPTNFVLSTTPVDSGAVADIVVDSSGDFCTVLPIVFPLPAGTYNWDLTIYFANGMVETPYAGSVIVV